MEGDQADQCEREVCGLFFLYLYILQHPSIYKLILMTFIYFSMLGVLAGGGGGGGSGVKAED
jgi:hypothetical protein